MNRWNEYERRKRQWMDENPRATATEYREAMRRLADELGV